VRILLRNVWIGKERGTAMLALVFGGSGSGKSAWAEQLIMRLSSESRYYLATMVNCDDECATRIARHRMQRQDGDWHTIEKSVDLGQLQLSADSTVLLECLSTWLTNEYYRDHAADMPAKKIWQELSALTEQCANLIVVSNNVFADGFCYDAVTNRYIADLGWLHQKIAQQADLVVEVVVGLPVIQKGALPCVGCKV